MVTVGEFLARVNGLLDKLQGLKANIVKSVGKLPGGKLYEDDLTQSEIDALNEEANTYDRKFEEEQYKFLLNGGKSRKQTLQEFVILFFFVSYALLTVSFIVYGNAMDISTSKIFFGMLFILLMISGIILRYA
jgi:hypothetical protein